MKTHGVKIALNLNIACLIAMLLLMCSVVFAQKVDTSRISLRPKTKPAAKFPVIKGSVQPYKPNVYNYLPSVVPTSSTKAPTKEKAKRTLLSLKSTQIQ